jgi:hypothetical protein
VEKRGNRVKERGKREEETETGYHETMGGGGGRVEKRGNRVKERGKREEEKGTGYQETMGRGGGI